MTDIFDSKLIKFTKKSLGVNDLSRPSYSTTSIQDTSKETKWKHNRFWEKVFLSITGAFPDEIPKFNKDHYIDSDKLCCL